jgi:hypothetical protein
VGYTGAASFNGIPGVPGKSSENWHVEDGPPYTKRSDDASPHNAAERHEIGLRGKKLAKIGEISSIGVPIS